MKILLLGSGGREHALAWKIAQSDKCEKLYIAPGNAGTSNCGINIPMKADDFEVIKQFVVAEEIDMVVVGPEDPLVKGIYDNLKADERTKNVPVIGPSKAGAVLEGSKDFAKAFMQRHNIPTARYQTFDGEHWKRLRHPMSSKLTVSVLARAYSSSPPSRKPRRSSKRCLAACLAMLPVAWSSKSS